MKYFFALVLAVTFIPSANAVNTRLIDQWAFTKDNQLLFITNDTILKKYEPAPLHCPVEKIEKISSIVQKETPNIFVHGTRLKENTKVSFRAEGESVSCRFVTS